MSAGGPSAPESGRGPVVVVFLDGWGMTDSGPRVGAETPCLSRLVQEHPWSRLAATGEAVGAPRTAARSEHAAYRTASSGAPARVARARLDALLEQSSIASLPVVASLLDLADDGKRSVTDFMTFREQPACTFHVFGLASDSSSHGEARDLAAVAEVLSYYRLPFVVHAITDGIDMPPQSAWRCLEPLEESLDGGTIATLSGRGFALDARGDWDRTLEVFRAVVLGEDVPVSASVYESLVSHYDAEVTDDELRPIRIGDYAGVRGELVMEMPSETGEWAWRGHDVALLVGVRGEGFSQLAAALTGVGVPDHVAPQLLWRGRRVIAFEPGRVASLVDLPSAAHVAVALPDEKPAFSLSAFFADRGDRQLYVSSPGREHHLEWYFTAGAPPHPSVARERAPSDRAALERAADDVAARRSAVVVVAIGGLEAASRSADPADLDRALAEMDGALGALASSVLDAGGVLLLTSTHGRAGDPPDAHAPLLVVRGGPDRVVLRPEGTFADLAPTLLELAGATPPEGVLRQSLLSRPS